jgi:protein TonB
MLKPAVAEGRRPIAVKKKWTAASLVLTFVVTAHALAFAALLAQSAMTPPVVEEPVMPMMVSLVSEPAPAPEVTPVVPEPPKPAPVVKKAEPKPKPAPKPKPKPVVEQPVAEPQPVVQQPIAQQPIVQQPIAPPVQTEQPVIDEQPSPLPVKQVPVAEKAPALEPALEPAIEPPSFGAAYLNNPPPRYPTLSRRMGEEGRVLLRVLVAKNGNADKVEVEKGSGSERLDEAALEAVRKWKFVPAKQNNQPVSAYVLVPMKFSLRDS